MKILQLVLSVLLCLYVFRSWQSGEQAFRVIGDFSVPFWIAVPVAAITLGGAVLEFRSHRAKLTGIHREPTRSK